MVFLGGVRSPSKLGLTAHSMFEFSFDIADHIRILGIGLELAYNGASCPGISLLVPVQYRENEYGLFDLIVVTSVLCVFFQSEINTSVHHSYATLDKRTEAMSQKVQLHGRYCNHNNIHCRYQSI